MGRTVICPHCQQPHTLWDTADASPGSVYCEHCGGPLPLRALAAARPITVVWIDDDRLLLGACTEVLQRAGYRTLTATDGPTGIALARQEQPDVILLDVVMPTMGGLEVCQRLRAEPNLKDIPIILLTSLDDADLPRKGEQAGATATVRKPMGPAHVVTILIEALD